MSAQALAGQLIEDLECNRFAGPLRTPIALWSLCTVLGVPLYLASGQGHLLLIGSAYFLLTILLIWRRAPQRIAIHEQGLVVTLGGDARFVPWCDVEQSDEDVYQGRARVFGKSSATLYLVSGSLSLPRAVGAAIKRHMTDRGITQPRRPR